MDLVLDCIDHLHQRIGPSRCAEAAQRDSEWEWESCLDGFYKLLGEIGRDALPRPSCVLFNPLSSDGHWGC